jgi:hypothetical protein
MTGSCVYCGEPATEQDHITGRPAGHRPYFDADLWVLTCVACNKLAFQTWRALGIDRVGDTALARLRRLAVFAARMSDREPPDPLRPTFWDALARCFTEIADDIEGRP